MYLWNPRTIKFCKSKFHIFPYKIDISITEIHILSCCMVWHYYDDVGQHIWWTLRNGGYPTLEIVDVKLRLDSK